MDPAISRQLVDKMYEKRKAAALDLEKQIRECHQQGDQRRITQIIDQLVDMFSTPTNPLHVKNGGLIGLAGTGIALGVDVAPFMEKFIEPLLVCFSDTENRIRYFSAECLYNIAKVSKGEILVYFNPIFDALSKLAADSELSVKNGAELLDRLLKDIVAESASVYVPQFTETEKARQRADQSQVTGILVPHPEELDNPSGDGLPVRKAFSLAHFIPLLSDRIYVVSPFTRSFLVSWITVMDSVPELELITYLPEFLDGLLKYLSDPTEDVRVATEHLLADFLHEVRDVANVQRHRDDGARFHRELDQYEQNRRPEVEKDRLPDITMSHPERAAFISEDDGKLSVHDGDSIAKEEGTSEVDYRDTGAWVPGQGVKVDHAAIVEILIQQLDSQHDEIQQSTALVWLAEFLNFAQEVMVPFTPRLIAVILPNLAHHVPMIQSAALRTNQLLFTAIQNLSSPRSSSPQQMVDKASITSSRTAPQAVSPPPSASPVPSRQSTMSKEQMNVANTRDNAPLDSQLDVNALSPSDKTAVSGSRHRSATVPPPNDTSTNATSIDGDAVYFNQTSRSHSPTSTASVPALGVIQPSPQPIVAEIDPFDYHETVNVLTVQFLSEHEETRVATLKWLIMLHQKTPKKFLAMGDETFPALLKTLSDPSEDVIKHDLQLLAQISSSSEEGYFKSFMVNLLELFSTDRRFLETRGSLIIRQLCLNLNTERIYRTLAEILEKEEDLEFASVMVQKLNIILITSPELADFRRRLKSLEIRQDGQALFTTLYRSWCHNAVAVFALCLLAQAYEHASNLLSIFADLEITVQLLVQVDKLVQLIESPVFTYIRLQLLEPEKYPYLFKCLYGLLMVLPQSTAFVSLRNRLNAVNSAGFLHIAPRSTAAPFSARSKVGRGDEIKWQELLTHFRSVQSKHEKARRQALGMDGPSSVEFLSGEKGNPNTTGSRPAIRRKVTGEGLPLPSSNGPPRGSGALSPLNPRARTSNGLLSFAQHNQVGGPRSKSPTGQGAGQNKTKRTLSLGQKP